MIDIPNIKPNSNSICVSQDNLTQPLIKQLQESDHSNYWHKFAVWFSDKNKCNQSRSFILKTIMEFVAPCDFVPFNFMARDSISYFLVGNCMEAILKIVDNKLILPNPQNRESPLKMIIILNICLKDMVTVNIESEVLNVLHKRFKKQTLCLNLDSFCEDPELHEFIPLQQPKMMKYVLTLAKELGPMRISLKHNDIRDVTPLTVLMECKIKVLYLQNNHLTRIADLEPLKIFKNLEDIYLDENPLCDGYDRFNYISELKAIIPRLRKLDNVLVFHMSKLIKPVKNYLCSNTGGDLLEQFIEHFFTAYDFDSRQGLIDLYHEDALFSITSRIVPNHISSNSTHLGHFATLNRNLLSLNKLQDVHERLYRGRGQIKELLLGFPRSYHDPFRFNCDLIYYSERIAVIVVTGVFREPDQFLGFCRNFILQGDDGEYCIINDQLHIYNGLNCQTQVGHKFSPRLEYSYNPIPYSREQYQELEEAFHQITSVNYEYSHKYLTEFHYDLKRTLQHFTKLCLKDDVPEEAFMKGELEKPTGNFPEEVTSKLIKDLDRTARNVYITLSHDRILASEKSKPIQECITEKPIMQNASQMTNTNNGILAGKASAPQITSSNRVTPKIAYGKNNMNKNGVFRTGNSFGHNKALPNENAHELYERHRISLKFTSNPTFVRFKYSIITGAKEEEMLDKINKCPDLTKKQRQSLRKLFKMRSDKEKFQKQQALTKPVASVMPGPSTGQQEQFLSGLGEQSFLPSSMDDQKLSSTQDNPQYLF